MKHTVLVTGATGNIGSQVIHRIAAEGTRSVRAFVRDAEKGAALKAAGAELAVGTFEDQASVEAALHDVDTLVLITAPNPHAAEQASAVLTAAKSSGVRKVVRISVINAASDGPTDNVRQHAVTDAMILASGMTHVILRPQFFMQNLFMSIQNLAGDGNMYWGMGDGRMSMIDVRDIVDCTVNAVLSDTFDNGVFPLTGPASITFHDVAKTFSDALGKPVQYIPVPPEAVEQSLLEMGMGDWFASVMKDYSKAYSENWGDLITHDVERLAGRPARSIDAFAREILLPALKGIG